MADEQSSSLAFQDDFTKSHGGACFFVSVDPVFDEQIIEAVTLIARSRPENVRVSYISQFAAAAKAAAPTPEVVDDDDGGEGEDREKKEAEEESEETKEAKRKVVKDMLSSIKGLRLEGTDKEFEGFANLILSLILSLFASSHPDFPTLILILSDALSFSADRSANPTLSARYSSLATIFNSLPSPATNALRLTVLLKLISYASSNDDFSVIQPALARLESWLVEWGFGPGTSGEEEGNAAIATVVSSLLAKSRLAEARTLLLAHLSSPSAVSGTSTTPSSSTAKLASQLIGLSLALPTVFDFSSLSTLPAVASPSVPTLATLLSMFQTGDVAAFEQFAKENQAVLDEQKLDAGALERKLRLLALAELCSKRVGELVSYEEIATALRLQADAGDDGEEVETWVIDAIRASLISGRLSQSLLSFHVTRAAPRAFTASHWTQLESRLQGWRTSLDAILDSVAKGVQIDGGHGQGAVEVGKSDSAAVQEKQEGESVEVTVV